MDDVEMGLKKMEREDINAPGWGTHNPKMGITMAGGGGGGNVSGESTLLSNFAQFKKEGKVSTTDTGL